MTSATKIGLINNTKSFCSKVSVLKVYRYRDEIIFLFFMYGIEGSFYHSINCLLYILRRTCLLVLFLIFQNNQPIF